MLDTKKLYEELREYESKKEEIIQISIKLAKQSKTIVYSLIRGDIDSAKKYIDVLKSDAKRLKEMANKWPMFYHSAAQGLQEYVEALSLFSFLSENRIPSRDELGVDVMTYLMGIGDMAGELSRKATEELIKGNISIAERLRKAVERLYLDLLELEPRDFELRKKADYVANQVNWMGEKLFYATTCRKTE